MIHRFVRAVFLRSSTPAPAPRAEPRLTSERLRSIAPLGVPRRLRICSDPTDARRTVITGRFADVCAALDRLVQEQEAVA